MDTFRADLKYSLRIFMHGPAFTVTAIAALALGIGANTAVFSVVNTVLLKPLAYRGADRIVQLEDTYAGVASTPVGPKNFNFWRQQSTLLQDVSAHWLDYMNLTSESNPELMSVALVTADFFRLYGAPVIHGRTVTADEDRPNGGHFVVLSFEMWMRRFGADPEAVGKTISLGDISYAVVGVLGPFNTEMFGQRPDVWIPFQIDPDNKDKDSRLCYVTGRLKLGATLDMTRAELQLVAEAYRRAFPGAMRPKDGFTVQTLKDALVGDVRPSLLVLAGSVGLVLLIACANVANLLLVRATARRREMALRAALGAGRWRIIRQLLTESVTLSLAGGGLGLALGFAGIRALLSLYPSTPLGPGSINPVNIPRIGEAGSAVALDWHVLAFTVLVSLLTGVFFGILPAFQVSRVDLNTALKEGTAGAGTGIGRTKTLSLLVVCEMTLALILLIGGGLLIRTSVNLRSVNPGFESHNVLTLQMSIAGARFEHPSGVDRLVRDGIRQIRTLPGVQNVAAACCLPLETVWQLPYIVAGRPLSGRFHGFARWTFISPEYFEAFRIPLLHGRTFTDRDDSAAPGVVIINETMARLIWPRDILDREPLNDRLLIGRTMGPEYEKDPARQIVGIVGDVRDVGLNRKPRPIMYVPIAQVPDAVKALELPLLPMAWIVRTRARPQSLAAAIGNELRTASGGLPVARIRSMEDITAQSTMLTQFHMLLMTAFAGAALVLAAIGIYGLMAYTVQQRMREIGIRLALGAQARDVRRIVLVHAMRLLIIGTAIGLPAAFGLTRVIASFLFGVTARDPLVFATVPLILGAVALLAVWFPAHRAGRIDPVDALRYE